MSYFILEHRRLARACRLTLACLALSFSVSLPSTADEPSPRRIYVPTEDLDALINRDHGGVLLSRDEFDRLLRDAHAQGRQHTPEKAVLASTVYSAQVDGEQLVLTIDVTGNHFQPGWATLPIRAGGLGIESATIGDEAALITRGDPPEVLHWLLQKAGAATVKLQASLPLEVVGSDRVAIFDLAGAPTGELRVSLPAGKHLQIGGVTLKRPAEQDQPAEYVLPIGGQKSIELRITDRAAESQADALTFASTAHGLYVAPGEVTWSAKTALQVIGRKIDRLVASVPRGVEITAIESTGLESWELADLAESPDRTTITLTWRQAFDGTRGVEFRGVLSGLDGGDWTAPNLQLNEVTSHTGAVDVQYPAGVRVQPRNLTGARASAAADAAALAPAAVGRLRFDVWEQDFQLDFTTAVKSREVHAAMTNLIDVTNDGLQLFSLVDVTPQFDSLFDVQLSLPAEWEMQSLSVDDAEVKWTSIPMAAGANEYRIPLELPLPPGESRSVRMVARRLLENWPVEQTPVRFALPEIRLPQASVVEGLYGVTGEDDLLLTPVDVTGLDPARREDLQSLEQQLAAQARTLRLGFAYQDTVFSAQVEAVRKPTRLSAATLSFVELARETVDSHLETQLRVQGGGLKQLQVSLPEEIGTDVRFRLSTVYALRAAQQVWAASEQSDQQQVYRPIMVPPRIVEQSVAAPAEGRRTWTLKFDRRLSGDVVIWADVRQPRGEQTDFTPPVLTIVGAERQNGHIAVIAGNDQRVTLTATDADSRPLPLIDPVEFPESFTFPVQALRSGRRRIVAGVQYLQPGYTVGISDQRFDRTAVPTAVGRAATYETVISPSGELQHEATYEIVAVGVQSLQVQLPAGDTLWAVLLDGQPVEVRTQLQSDAASELDPDAVEAPSTFLIPLPPVEPPDQPRTVKLLYRGTTPALKGTGSFRQTPPELSAVTGQGSEQPIELLDQNWVVHHSPDTLLLASHGRFHTDEPLYLGTLLSRLTQLTRLPSAREWRRIGLVLLAVVVGLAIVVFLLRRVGLLFTVLIVAALIVVPALLAPMFVLSSASRTTEEATVAAEYYKDFYDAGELEGFERPDSRGGAMGGFGGGGFGVGGMAAKSGPANATDAPQDPFAASDAIVGGIPLLTTSPPSPSAVPPGGTTIGRPQMETPNADVPFRQGSFSLGVPQPASPATRGRYGVELNLNTINNPAILGQAQQPAEPPVSPKGFGAVQVDADRESFRRGNNAGKEALLSLTLALAPPDRFVSREFRYVGSETDPENVDIEVAYADRSGSQMLLAVIAGGALLLFWWLRRTPLALRALLAAVAIAGPLALAALVPAAWLVPLDGLLIGGVLGVALWLLLGFVNWLPRCCRKSDAAGPKLEVGTPSTTMAVWLVVALSLFVPAASQAEEPSASPPPPAPAVTPPLVPEATRPVVIIPYAAGTDPLAAEQVLVPQDYYLKLWRAARPDEQPASQPPSSGVVAAAIYQAELDSGAIDKPNKDLDRTVKVTARFVLRQLSDESMSLPLPIGPVAIESAKLDDQPATLRTKDDGRLEVVLAKPGLQLLDVVFRIPAQNVTTDSGRFTLPLKPVASGRLSFAIPGNDETEVRINGATDAYRIRDVDGKRVIETHVDRGGDLSLVWRPRAAHGAGEGTIQVESTIGATAADAGLTVRHRFRYVVSQGSLSDVSFTLPTGTAIKRIAGADVSGWEQGDADEQRTLKVFLRRDVDDSTSLDLDLFRAVTLTETATAVDVPTLQPVGVTREKGDVALFAEPQLAVQAGEATGLRQVNVANFTMDAALTQPGVTARFAYRFDGRPFTLPVSLSRRQPETRVVSEHGAQARLRKVFTASRFQFDLREAPRANLSFTLPADYLPLDVQGDYLVDWTVSDENGGRVLTLELDQPRTGRLQVLLQGTQPRDPAAAAVTITIPQPLAINRQESQLGIWIDEAFTATVGTPADWRPLDPAELGQAIRELQPALPQFGFRSTQTTPGPIVVDLQRAQAELSADAVVVTAASDAAIDYGLTLRWRIDRAAADQFLVATPDWLGDQIDFTGEGIRQIERLPRASGGYAWRITLHEPVTEQFLVTAAVTRPLPADDAVKTPDLRFLRPDQPVDEATELNVQRRFLVLVNLSDLHRLDVADAIAIVPAQREQLPLKLPAALLNQAIEIASLPVGRNLPEWKLMSTTGTQEAAATVLLADLRTVLAHDGSWRTQADYRVRNRGRQFLAIVPPAESRLLSVMVREQPTEAIRQQQDGLELLLVPLPATSMVDLSFTVRLVLAGRLSSALPESFALMAREVSLPAPQVATKAQSAEYGLPVLQTLWRVDVPDDIRASLVEGSGRSNVIRGDADAGTTAYARQSLDDLKSILSVAPRSKSSQVGSGRQSLNANQLSNLNLAIENANAFSGTAKAEVAQELELAIEEAHRQVEELQQQTIDSDLDGASLDRYDFGRNLILNSNGEIAKFNQPSSAPSSASDFRSDSDAVINFSLNGWIRDEIATAEPEAKAQGKKQDVQQRAAVKEQLAGQELRYFNSELAEQFSPPPPVSEPSRRGLRSHTMWNQLDDGLPSSGNNEWMYRFGDDAIAAGRQGGGDLQAGTTLLDDVAGRSTTDADWIQTGGLSIDMPLPEAGQPLTFTKVGGDPRLTLSLRSGDSVRTGLGLVWALICLGLAFVVVRWVSRRAA